MTLANHHLFAPFTQLGAMQRCVTFNDLPVELAERIIRLAAPHALNDKAWLAQLTRTSRTIHMLVQPILVDTVFVTAWSLPRIFFFPTLFVSTRRLVVERKCRSEYLRYIVLTTPAFQQIDMLCGSAWALDILLNVCTPSRVVVTRYSRSEHEWTATPDELDSHLSRLTHFRGMFSSAVLLLYLMGEDRWKSLPITHIILGHPKNIHVGDSVGLRLSFLLDALSKLLRLPALRRLCIIVTHLPADWTSSLSAFAHEHRETRLWINTVDPEYDPRTVFGDENWLAGEQLFSDE